MPLHLLALFAMADWIALAIFAIGWFAYSLISDRAAGWPTVRRRVGG